MKILSLTAAFVFALASAGSVDAAPKANLSIELEQTRVVVTNVTTGGAVAVFGASRQAGDSIRLQRFQRVFVDTDRDGRIEWSLDETLPSDAVWVVVDVDTGGTAVTAPPASRFTRIDFPAPVLRRNGENQIDRLVTGRRMIDVLVVRPRVGAWVGFAADGFGGDGDGRHDGRSTVAFAAAKSLTGRTAAPKHLSARDVVVAIDVRGLEYYMSEVPE